MYETPFFGDVRSLILTPYNTPLPSVSGAGPLVTTQTGTPGAVSVDVAENAWKLPIAATNEAEANRLSFGGLRFPIANIKGIGIKAKCSALDSTTLQAAFGFCSTPNDDTDAIAEGCFFKIGTDDSIVVESDDGTTNVDDVSTGQTNAAGWRYYWLNLADAVKLGDPRFGGNVGGRAIIQPSMTIGGLLRPVARGTQFDLSGYSGRIQPFAQIIKGASTDTGSLHIAEIRVDYVNNLAP